MCGEESVAVADGEEARGDFGRQGLVAARASRDEEVGDFRFGVAGQGKDGAGGVGAEGGGEFGVLGAQFDAGGAVERFVGEQAGEAEEAEPQG